MKLRISLYGLEALAMKHVKSNVNSGAFWYVDSLNEWRLAETSAQTLYACMETLLISYGREQLLALLESPPTEPSYCLRKNSFSTLKSQPLRSVQWPYACLIAILLSPDISLRLFLLFQELRSIFQLKHNLQHISSHWLLIAAICQLFIKKLIDFYWLLKIRQMHWNCRVYLLETSRKKRAGLHIFVSFLYRATRRNTQEHAETARKSQRLIELRSFLNVSTHSSADANFDSVDGRAHDWWSSASFGDSDFPFSFSPPQSNFVWFCGW